MAARWTAEQDAALRARYASEHNQPLAHDLGRTVSQLVSRANRLGLRKDRLLMARSKHTDRNPPPDPQDPAGIRRSVVHRMV
jgi:hypothetical protein